MKWGGKDQKGNNLRDASPSSIDLDSAMEGEAQRRILSNIPKEWMCYIYMVMVYCTDHGCCTVSEWLQWFASQSSWWCLRDASCCHRKYTGSSRTMSHFQAVALEQILGKVHLAHWLNCGSGSSGSCPLCCGSSCQWHFQTCGHQWHMHSLPELRISGLFLFRWLSSGRLASRFPTPWI